MKKTKKLKILIRKNFDILKKLNHKDFILVYNMGKVGSSTICNSIDKGINLHSLEGISNKYFSSKIQNNLLVQIFYYFRWYYITKKVKEEVNKKNKKNDKIKIITGFRDPISRNLSAFFQTLSEEKNKNMSIEDLKREFYLFANHFTPIYWFENEINKYFDIDIFKYNFDKDKGFTVISNNNFEIFVYRIDKLSFLESELANFLNLNNFTLENTNKSINKWYYNKYQILKKEIKFNESFLDEIYNNDVIKFFYTNSEILSSRKKWSK